MQGKSGGLVSVDQSLDVVRFALRSQERPWREIAKKAGVTYRWVVSFASGHYADVRMSKVEALAKALGLTVRVSVMPRVK